MNRKKTLFLAILLVTVINFTGVAQRRSRPGSMKHNQTEYDNTVREDPVKCNYVSNGHRFYGPVYVYTGGDGRIKIGNSSLTFSGGKYTLRFTSDKVKTRDHGKVRWKYEKVLNDFEQTGKYATYQKFGEIYLGIYIEDEDGKMHLGEIKLSGKDAKEIEWVEDDLWFDWKLSN